MLPFFCFNSIMKHKWGYEMQRITAIWVMAVVLLAFGQPFSASSEEKSAIQKQWEERSAKINGAWDTYTKEIRRIWKDYTGSTAKIWTSYSEDKTTRSFVDFDNGTIKLEVLVKEGEGKKEAEKKIQEQFSSLMEKKVSGEYVLDKQIEDPQKKVVTKENAPDFVRKVVLPKVEKQEQIIGEDKVKRRKFAVVVKLGPKHLQNRVEKYWPLIKPLADKLKLRKSLILGTIHMESSFNPLAISIPIKRKKYTTHAYGLMQVVPELAGTTVYRLLNGSDGKPTPKDLYDPATNIQYGLVFIHHLHHSSVCSKLKDTGKIEDCSIVAYNAGGRPFVRARKKETNLDEMSREEFRETLLKYAPNDYLTMVRERMAKWSDFDEL